MEDGLRSGLVRLLQYRLPFDALRLQQRSFGRESRELPRD